MKTLLLVLSLLALLLVLPPAGHSAHHHVPTSCVAARLLPLRVVRTHAVAQRRRLVRAVQ